MDIFGYSYETPSGTFGIVKSGLGDWLIWCNRETLGQGYASPEHALDDLIGGHCDWPDDVDPSTLGIPDDFGSWSVIPMPT